MIDHSFVNFSLGLKRYDFEISEVRPSARVFVEHDHGVEEATKVGKNRWYALLPVTSKKTIKVHENRSGWEVEADCVCRSSDLVRNLK